MLSTPTTPEQIDIWRAAKTETETLEFKEAKNHFDFKTLLLYCVAIANERGGILLLGIANKPPRLVVGTRAFPNVVKTTEDLFNNLRFRVDIENVHHPNGRVLVFHIPSRPIGHPYHLDGKYYMRSGESLVAMSPDQLKKIVNEQRSIRPRVISLVTVLIFLIIGGFALAEYWREDKPFIVSNGALASINMTQSLETENSGDWWITYQSYAGETASPVALVQYVEITNMRSSPETIRNYSAAIKTVGCGWTYLTPIPLQSVAVWQTTDGLRNAFREDFRTNGMDYIFKNPIPPKHTVTGWWFFDSKVKCDVPEGSKVQYRFSLKTFDKIEFEYTTPEINVSNKGYGPGNTEGQPNPATIVVPPNARRDISHLYRRLWSAPTPN